MIDKATAEKAFRNYADAYDPSDIMISSKIFHTMRVADNAERIAISAGLDGYERDCAWLLGLLHDFGRFEQVKRYGTFSDIHSVDHAELGADILFKEGKINLFKPAGIKEEDTALLDTAIRLHNKLTLPDDQDERTRTFCDILRDADKIDIFRVVSELSLDQRAGKHKEYLTDKDEASEEVMECVFEHRCIPRALVGSGFELHVSHICMAFELVFDKSYRIVSEQGYFMKLLALKDDRGVNIWNEGETGQLVRVREEVDKVFSQRIGG